MPARIILACLLVAITPEALAQVAGRVLSAAGEVVATRAGRDVALTAGSTVERGDVIRVGEESTAQIRFSDEAIVALRARTRFAISEYRFTGQDDGISQAAYNLLQGGLRTLTGLIGKARRDRFTLSTKLATVGIRGTAFTVVLCQQDCVEADGTSVADGAYGVVFDGRIAVSNDAGTAEFGAEEAFYVSDIKSLPQPLVGRPGFLRDRMEARARRERREQMEERRQAQQQAQREAAAARPPASSSEAKPQQSPANQNLRPVGQLGASSSPIIVVTDLRDPNGNVALVGVGLGAGVGFAGASEPFAVVDGGRGTLIELDRDRGFVERFVFNEGAQSGSRGNALVLDNGKIEGDGGAVWGRWAPGASVTGDGQTGVPPTGVHFFFGNLTPEALFGTIPTGAVAVRYDYAGGPRPTNERGMPGQFLSGTFIVNFLQRAIQGQLNYRIDDYTYLLPVPSGTPLVAGRGFVGFNVSATNGGSWQCACSGTSGTLDRYSVSGLFLGSRAQGLGVNFATVDSVSGRTAGAGVFRCVSGGCK
jgi:hypothetical protein